MEEDSWTIGIAANINDFLTLKIHFRSHLDGQQTEAEAEAEAGAGAELSQHQLWSWVTYVAASAGILAEVVLSS